MYHTTKTGELKKCRAKSPDKCPFGAWGHFEDAEKAISFNDAYNSIRKDTEKGFTILNPNQIAQERFLRENFSEEDVEMIQNFGDKGMILLNPEHRVYKNFDKYYPNTNFIKTEIKTLDGQTKILCINMTEEEVKTLNMVKGFVEKMFTANPKAYITQSKALNMKHLYIQEVFKSKLSPENFSLVKSLAKNNDFMFSTYPSKAKGYKTTEIELLNGEKRYFITKNKTRKPSTKKTEKTQYYSKKNPHELIMPEMRVPKLYETEHIPNHEKEIHAAYILPVISDWTWYMTEYDPKTKDAFGVVVGNEVEWGYFNIEELKSLGAQRLILEDFPKKAKELTSEFSKQMTNEEITKCFGKEIWKEE